MAQTQQNILFDHGAKAHHPHLYVPCDQVPAIAGTLAITDATCRAFHEQGYLAFADVLNSFEVASALEALTDMIDVDGPAELHFEAGVKDRLNQLRRDERRDAVRKIFHFCAHNPQMASLAAHPKLLRVVERLIGEPVSMIQDMALLKPPHTGREKPWHQDHAYFDYPVETRIVGVWISLDEATVLNGCMHVLPRWHREGPIVHFQRRDWQICDDQIMGRPEAKCVAIPLKPGGVLFFDSLLPHGTPTNRTRQRRRALQFHYAPSRARKTDVEERLAIFGSEGKDVTC